MFISVSQAKHDVNVVHTIIVGWWIPFFLESDAYIVVMIVSSSFWPVDCCFVRQLYCFIFDIVEIVCYIFVYNNVIIKKWQLQIKIPVKFQLSDLVYKRQRIYIAYAKLISSFQWKLNYDSLKDKPITRIRKNSKRKLWSKS